MRGCAADGHDNDGDDREPPVNPKTPVTVDARIRQKEEANR